MATTQVGVKPMKAAQVPKAGADFQIVEREIPKPGAGQVRIKVQACGVCHSDVFTKEGSWPGIEYPRVPGHEVAGLIDRFNNSLKAGEARLYAPHIKFNRAIGKWAGQKCHAETGEPLDDRSYEEHLKDYMPSAADKKLLLDIIETEKKWIAEKTGARDPLSTIGEVRKSAINL